MVGTLGNVALGVADGVGDGVAVVVGVGVGGGVRLTRRRVGVAVGAGDWPLSDASSAALSASYRPQNVLKIFAGNVPPKTWRTPWTFDISLSPAL